MERKQPQNQKNQEDDQNGPSQQRQDNGANTEESLSDRIRHSARELARQAVMQPSGHGLGSDLAQALANDKVSSSSSSSIRGHQSLHAVPTTSSGSSGAANNLQPGTFRSAPQQTAETQLGDEASRQWHEFQHDYGDLQQVNSSPHADLAGKDKGKQRVQDNYALENAWRSATNTATTTTTTAAEATDGAAVVELLSSPLFHDEVSAGADSTTPPLTETELEILDSFRRHAGTSGRALSSRSFIPGIDTVVENGHGEEDPLALRDRVLSQLPGSEDWLAVEEKYTDEVWGYLRPTLEAALEELKLNKSDEEHSGGEATKVPDGPAVRRLKMILRHMRE
ncbi:hypothetical protein VTN49DRAFT_3208 [Thermomyces lanuginosus]|uniref:uncharacterized protein n=1 Tax=Thermomyces lanuginosus TaxID=5541 RepID=UPI003742A72F